MAFVEKRKPGLTGAKGQVLHSDISMREIRSRPQQMSECKT
jgi:hypothetical protein